MSKILFDSDKVDIVRSLFIYDNLEVICKELSYDDLLNIFISMGGNMDSILSRDKNKMGVAKHIINICRSMSRGKALSR